MAYLIKTTDNLNEGRIKLNKAIINTEEALTTAKTADELAKEAKTESESTRTQLDNIVIEGDSSVEAAQARVDSMGQNHPTLKSRIDNFEVSATQQLAEKADASKVRTIDVPIGLNDTDGELLAAIASSEGANFNLLSIPRLASVNSASTTFVRTGKNLFNPNAVTQNTTLNSAGGLKENTLYATSEPISVKKGEVLGLTKMRMFMFFHTDGSPQIGTYDDSNSSRSPITVTAPGDGYIRISVLKTDLNLAQVEKGLNTSYEPFKLTIDGFKVTEDNMGVGVVKKEHLAEGSIFDRSRNMFDKSKITPNTYVTSSGYPSSVHYDLSDFIPANSNLTHHISAGLRNLAYFDANRQITRLVDPLTTNHPNDPYTFTPDTDAVFFRVAVHKNRTDSIMINTGSKLLPYEPGNGIVVKDLIIDKPFLTDNFLRDIGKEPPIGCILLNFGDSIAAGDGDRDGSGRPYGYSKRIGDKTGMTVHNYAKGGATIGKTTNHTVLEQVQQAKVDNIGASVVLVNGQTNDIGQYNVPLGEVTSGYTDTFDIGTFSGGLEETFRTISQQWKDAPIIYVTAHKMPSRDANKQKTYHQRALEICAKWSVSVVDIFKSGGMNTNISWHEGRFTAQGDPTHPNGVGYDVHYVPKITAEIKRVLI